MTVTLARSKPVPAPGPRRITILGATGSIGASTIDLIKREPDRYRVEAVTARKNALALAKLAREVRAQVAVVADHSAYRELKDALAGTNIEAASGEEALHEAGQRPADWVMAAISGAIGLKPTLAAVERGATVALANKECLVCAGSLFMRKAASAGATRAAGRQRAQRDLSGAGRRTARGRRAGLFSPRRAGRSVPGRSIRSKHATPEQALRHPNWSMGPRITVDSASMMNKGLELIEAQHLFALAPQEIDVLVHPQSVVHGLVEFRDGSVVAQLGSPDMRIPIAHCLGLAASHRHAVRPPQFGAGARVDLRGARSGPLSGRTLGAPRDGNGRRRADRDECRRRDRSRGISRRPASHSRRL